MDKFIPGTHILWSEYRCKCCRKLPPDFYISINKKTINLKYIIFFSCFEWIRSEYGGPIIVSRGYSCTRHQLFIYLSIVLKKYETLNTANIGDIIRDPVMTPFSVHLFGLGLDLKPPIKDIPKIVEIAKRARPKLRIGWKAYDGRNIYNLSDKVEGWRKDKYWTTPQGVNYIAVYYPDREQYN